MHTHAPCCRSLEFTGGIPWPCDCNAVKHDAEVGHLQGRLSGEQRRAARLEAERNTLRAALSEIFHLGDEATLDDAREIAYSAVQVTAVA